MSLVIRKANVADAQGIIDYCNMVAGQSDNLAFGQGQFGVDLETEQEYLSSLEHNPNSFMMVAIIDNQIAGLGSVGAHARARLRHNTELGISIDEQYCNKE